VTAGVLVLAAGRAHRFGSDKRLARLPDDRRSIEALLDQLETSGLPVLVCLGPQDGEIVTLLNARGFRHQVCERSAEGMGGTLAEGIAQVDHWDGALVALADMPWIAGGTYRAVADSLDPGSICVPVLDGHRGHPVGFGRQFFPELAMLGVRSGKCLWRTLAFTRTSTYPPISTPLPDSWRISTLTHTKKVLTL
jgi:molybdenum cofactor cytidylyltransferase